MLQGNQYFKEKKYNEAIECYTRGIECDSSNALLPANRAMALLKQEKLVCVFVTSFILSLLDLYKVDVQSSVHPLMVWVFETFITYLTFWFPSMSKTMVKIEHSCLSNSARQL